MEMKAIGSITQGFRPDDDISRHLVNLQIAVCRMMGNESVTMEKQDYVEEQDYLEEQDYVEEITA